MLIFPSSLDSFKFSVRHSADFTVYCLDLLGSRLLHDSSFSLPLLQPSKELLECEQIKSVKQLAQEQLQFRRRYLSSSSAAPSSVESPSCLFRLQVPLQSNLILNAYVALSSCSQHANKLLLRKVFPVTLCCQTSVFKLSLLIDLVTSRICYLFLVSVKSSGRQG